MLHSLMTLCHNTFGLSFISVHDPNNLAFLDLAMKITQIHSKNDTKPTAGKLFSTL